MPDNSKKRKEISKRSPWWWVPSLYYAEGIPYVVVMLVSVVFYKRMGISNTEIAFYTSWLYLPWVIKPLWSPLVDILKTKRFWIVIMQLLIGAGLGGVALTIPLSNFFKITLGFFWLLAFSSATHDIAADGFYMLGLSQHKQAWFVGIRSTFYRFAMITGQGLLIMFAGYFESHTGLDDVDTKVIASTNTHVESTINMDSMNVSENDENLRIICKPEVLEISTVLRSKTEIDSIIQYARDWNIAQDHVEKNIETEEMDVQVKSISWWEKYVTENVKTFLTKYFQDKCKGEYGFSGNVGIFYFQLSASPDTGEEVVVNFSRKEGDKSISLVEGNRIVFDEQTWNIPALAVIQLDSQLKTSSNAIFRATSGNIPLAWLITFTTIAILFIIFFIYHKFILPYPLQDSQRKAESTQFLKNFINTFIQFFKKEKIGVIIAFILIYRFGEAQLVKIAPLFMLDATEVCGLALTTGQYGFVYGTFGMIMLTLGGILGGFVAAKHGLKFWIWWMALAMKLPDIVYVYLSYNLPDSYLIISTCVGFEQFGYGFGFTAYMLFMISVAEGEHKTAHYAICTGFMALGMMIPGMFSGWLQEIVGYQHFFIWVLLATIPGFILIKFIPIDPEFGKKIEKKK